MRKKIIPEPTKLDPEDQPQTYCQKPAYSLAEFLTFFPLSRAKLYEIIAARRLIARKEGASLIILDDDYRAYLKALPLFVPDPADDEKAVASGETVSAGE